MQYKIYLLCLGLILFFGNGCLWVPVPTTDKYYVLEGQIEVKQVDHSVILGGADHYSPAKWFTLNYRVGNKSKMNAVSLVEANYQYYSDGWQPLDVVSIKPLQITLVPKSKIVSKASPKRTEKTGEILHGHYKIAVKYILDGRKYECSFDFLYDSKVEAGVVGPWSGKNIN